MKMFHRRVGIVLLIYTIVKIVNCNNCFHLYSALQHDKYMTQVFRKLISDSIYACASECLMSSLCHSIGYEPETRTCFLNSYSSGRGRLDHRPGFIFSDIEHWPKGWRGECSALSCAKTSRCHVDRMRRATCVPEFQGCLYPPEVAGMRRTYEGLYEGAVASYRCKRDFKLCRNGTRSSCQPNGQWQDIAGLCDQFRWHNATVPFSYPIPCGPASRVKVTVRATATKAVRWNVVMQEGKDVLYMVDFRFKYGGVVSRTVANTEIGGQWGKEVSFPWLPVTLGQESRVVITLVSGVYDLTVDGVPLIKFKERTVGAAPDHISIEGDVAVTVMEVTT